MTETQPIPNLQQFQEMSEEQQVEFLVGESSPLSEDSMVLLVMLAAFATSVNDEMLLKLAQDDGISEEIYQALKKQLTELDYIFTISTDKSHRVQLNEKVKQVINGPVQAKWKEQRGY